MRGSCCCGAVRFELTEPPSMMRTCHCSRCRKVGASTFVFVKTAHIRWLAGRDNVTRYVPEPPHSYARCFCRTCGTALGEIESQADSVPIAANALDDDPMVRNRLHEFVADKPAWATICDGAKQFVGHPQSA